MIESSLDTARVNNYEAVLSDYYPGSSQSDWDTEISEALKELTQDVQDMGYNLRKLCKRLSLTSSTANTYTANTSTGTETGTKSAEDKINRRRLTVNASAVSGSGTVTFTLKGTDDDSSETYTTITTLAVTATGDTTTTFADVYKYYRLDITGFTGITSITWTAYLIETTFEIPHLYKTLELIYRELVRIEGEVQWSDKTEMYENKYKDKLSTVKIWYDEDDGGVIGDTELDDDMREVTFGLGGNG